MPTDCGPAASPGWYETRGVEGVRYWDGMRWTDGPPPTSPTTALTQASSALGTQPGVYWLGLLSALLLIVGGFGPWATALNIVSISGTHGDGWIAIGIAVFAIVMLWLHASRGTRGPVIWVVLAGIAGAILGFVDRANIASKGSGDLLGEHVTLVRPAWGIYMVIVASLALAATGWALFRTSRQLDLPPPAAS
jgi:hypothetical protein